MQPADDPLIKGKKEGRGGEGTASFLGQRDMSLSLVMAPLYLSVYRQSWGLEVVREAGSGRW